MSNNGLISGAFAKQSAHTGGIDLSTKGDMHGYSTTNARIPISTNNFSLYGDSTAALGLKWAASPTSILDATGKMLYASSANTLAAISPGAENTVLTMGGSSVPSWAAAGGGGAWSFVEEITLGSDAADWTITPTTALDLSAYQEFSIQIMLNHITSAGDLNVRINGNATAAYLMEGIVVDDSVVTGLHENVQNESTLCPSMGADQSVRLEISWIENQFNTGRQYGRYFCIGTNEIVASGFFCLSDTVTSITSLEIRMSGGSIEADARARIYRLAAS